MPRGRPGTAGDPGFRAARAPPGPELSPGRDGLTPCQARRGEPGASWLVPPRAARSVPPSCSPGPRPMHAAPGRARNKGAPQRAASPPGHQALTTHIRPRMAAAIPQQPYQPFTPGTEEAMDASTSPTAPPQPRRLVRVEVGEGWGRDGRRAGWPVSAGGAWAGVRTARRPGCRRGRRRRKAAARWPERHARRRDRGRRRGRPRRAPGRRRSR
jgi:hypothetical protein